MNGLGRHNVSRGHSMGSLNGDRGELFLLDSTGKRIYNRTTSDPAANRYWYLMEFGSTAYQSYWVEAVKADIIDQSWVADGVFADGCQPEANGGYSAASSLYATGAAWSDAMNDFSASISGALLRYGQKVWCNRSGTASAAGVT